MNPYIVSAIMFGSLLFLIILGIPIAFGTAIVGLVCAFFLWGQSATFIMLTSISGVMNNWVLVAIPLFIFMALVLNEFGVVDDLYKALYKWSGPLRGGLAIGTILVGTIMAAMTGVVAGVTVALGLISLPQMLKYKYDKDISLGSIMAGGSLAQLIPPSIILVLYGAITQTSVGALFASGICCGLLLSALFCGYILIRTAFNKNLCPSLPPEERASWGEKFASLKFLILPSFLIIVVLGSILTGVTTPTEGAAIGCIGALICGVLNRRFTWKAVRNASFEGLKLTAFILWICVGAVCFGAAFDGIGGNALMIELTQTLNIGRWGVFAIMMFILFILGCFMDQAAIIFITAPMFAAVATVMEFHPIWFAILYLIFMIVGYITPPFGYALFYIKGVAPKEIHIGDIYRASLPFIGLELLGIALIIFFPQIAVWAPHMLFPKSVPLF